MFARLVAPHPPKVIGPTPAPNLREGRSRRAGAADKARRLFRPGFVIGTLPEGYGLVPRFRIDVSPGYWGG